MAALLDRACRALAELATTVTVLKERGIDPVRLQEAIGTALPAGRNVFHLLGTLAADAERRPGEKREASLPIRRGRGKRPGRKPLDPAKAQAALQLVAAGLSPTAAARQIGLGRSTVYREVRRASAQPSTQATA